VIFWTTISIILFAGYAALMLFYFIGWKRTRDFSVTGNFSPKTKVSIIIAARDEEENIEACIRSVLNQDYPKALLEVIAVDDSDSLAPLPPPVEREVRAALIRYVRNSGIGKKAAISTGINHATGELIITTDADCIAEKKWIATVVAYYEKFQPKMIAAPVAFASEKSWLEKWQALDMCGMMAITAGAIANGFPNMCNGANLAYPKKVFEEVGGFSGIDKQLSGDDVMVMLKIAKKYHDGIHFLKSKEAIVYTQAENTLSGLFQQRLRWLSKGTAFPDWKVSAVLVFSWLFNLSIILNFIAGFFTPQCWLIAAVTLCGKTFIELPLLYGGCAFFKKHDLIRHVLPAQALHILYVVFVGIASRFHRYTWKGRTFPKSLS
jgi:cellulose synthase/poly-beta-1,6-N-acetylglucosamine synthase-like glycosyltransferase